MLAKIWKKLLLAICIIACLFNITGKIVNRHSLKLNLEAINDGSSAFNFKTFADQESEKSNVIDGVINNTSANEELVITDPNGNTNGNNGGNNGNNGNGGGIDINTDSITGFYRNVKAQVQDTTTTSEYGVHPPKYQEVENPIVVEEDGRTIDYNKNR